MTSQGGAVAGGTTAGGGVAGGTQTTTATGGTTATSGTASCNYPACYANPVSGCIPVGDCVEQRVAMCGATACPQPLGILPSSIIANRCYGNGITAVEVTDTASTDMVTTVSKNGTVCYAYETQYSAASLTSLPMVLKNPAGTTVATYEIDSADGTATVTCSGGSPVVVSLDCGSSLVDSSTVLPCTQGTCAP
jgi:hypothetical protein